MDKDIIINEDASVAYLPGTQAVVFMQARGSDPSPNSPTAPKEAHTEPVALTYGINNVAVWGDDNLFPQHVIEDAEFSTLIQSTLEWKAAALYGSGIQYGYVEYDADGNEKFIPKKDPLVEAFIRQSNINAYLRESIVDFYYFYNCFPKLTMDRARKNVAMLTRVDSSFCRWEKQNPDNGLIENCHISARWSFGGAFGAAEVIPTIDPYYDPVYVTKNRKEFQYIYPVSYPTPGKTYYSLAAWNTIRTSKWFDVMKSIPIFKNAILDNQATVKYHVEVYTWWWEWKYSEWQTLDKDKKRELMKKELENFDAIMTGASNAGKTLMTQARVDSVSGKELPGWKITVVDNKIKDGMYIEDSQEGSTHFLFAMGVDGTLIGSAPGKGMGAGSGSDKRVAFNLYINNCRIHEDIILEPLYFIRDFNGWDPNYVFRLKKNQIMTLDTGKETKTKGN